MMLEVRSEMWKCKQQKSKERISLWIKPNNKKYYKFVGLKKIWREHEWFMLPKKKKTKKKNKKTNKIRQKNLKAEIWRAQEMWGGSK